MARDLDRAFFGHPIGLATLFFTEMFERFSYYGMRPLLMLYMTASVADGGRGMTAGGGGVVLSLFLSSVYLLSLPGGWIADRFIGQRLAVTIGGVGIAIGNAMLAMPNIDLYYPGLIAVALGTGLLKPNVSTIVGQLYRDGDIRRDSGFTIYYMGINIGATVAPIACGFLAQSTTFRNFLLSHGIDPNWAWHCGFAAAAVGMVFGLIQYLSMQHLIGEAGKHPTIPTDPIRAARDRQVLGSIVAALVVLGAVFVLIDVTPTTLANIFGIGLALGSIVLFYGLFTSARDAAERRRVLAMIPLFLGAIGFFGIFEQASSTLTVFAENLVYRNWLGFEIPSTYYQSVNGLFIVLLAPVFAYMWLRLAKRKKEPSSVNKFAIGMVFLALSFVIMLPTISAVTSSPPERVSATYLIMLYLLYTVSELFISPVGLSSMSKLAPTRLAGMVMGTWFLGTAIGNYLAGRAAQFSEARGFGFLFVFLIICATVMSIALFAVAPRIKKMMAAGGDGPFDKTEKAEPDPMPAARVVSEDKKT
jgi:proton-dependent oligopeptide transporter, POT family